MVFDASVQLVERPHPHPGTAGAAYFGCIGGLQRHQCKGTIPKHLYVRCVCVFGVPVCLAHCDRQLLIPRNITFTLMQVAQVVQVAYLA